MARKSIDEDLIRKLVNENRTMPEIIEETGYNRYGVISAMKRIGIKPKVHAQRGGPRKGTGPKPKDTPKEVVPQEPNLKTVKPLSDITAVDLLVAEKKQHQMAIIKIDQAIGILTA